MNYLDAARVIEIKLGGSQALAAAVAARVSVVNYSLVCGLLAGIPVREVFALPFLGFFSEFFRNFRNYLDFFFWYLFPEFFGISDFRDFFNF
jgi:hypothetical protein